MRILIFYLPVLVPKSNILRGCSGNGAIFTRDVQRDWKSIKGLRLYTMSCSDKLLLWNMVGLQGALLTHFVKPIYMNSLTIGMILSKFFAEKSA